MKTALPIVLLVMATTFLSGCKALFGNEGWFRDREDDYLASKRTERMKVPDGMETAAIDDLLVIPRVERTTRPAVFEVPRPEPLGTQSREKVSIQRVGDRSWILVESYPAEVWPAVRDFFEVNGISIDYESAAQGVMETGWLTGRGAGSTDLFRQVFTQFVRDPDVETRDKFRVRLEHGVRMGSTEIHLLHKSVMARDDKVSGVDRLRWPQKSDHPGLEAGMLLEMQVHLARGSNRARTVSLLAQSLVGKPKAVYARDADGNPVLRLELDFNRAWAAVGQALEDAEVRVHDLDRSRATYLVTWKDSGDGDEGGLLSRILPGGGDDDSDPEDTPDPALTYQVHLESSDSGSIQVRVRDSKGAVAPVPVSETLLGLVKENLS